MQLQLLKDSFIAEDGSEVFFTGELSSFQVDTLLFTDIPYEKAPGQNYPLYSGNLPRLRQMNNLFSAQLFYALIYSLKVVLR